MSGSSRQTGWRGKHVGTVLREMRIERGITQLFAASKLGMHQTHVARMESGTSDMRFRNVLRLLDAIGATLSDLETAMKESEEQLMDAPAIERRK